MKKFTKHTGKAVAIFQPNIDTDQILPKQFLKLTTKTGFGAYLFYDWRFDAEGVENSDFILNQPRYKDVSVLIAGKNFGGGSSREHAPWALADFGFRVIVAESFGEIFYNNCLKIGLLPIVLDENLVAELADNVEKIEDFQITIDLEKRQISDGRNFRAEFKIDEFRRECLVNGWDDIKLILQYEDKISEYEQRFIDN